MSWKHPIKRAAARTATRLGLHERVWRDRALIVAFHNVNDGPVTPISIQIEAFKRAIDWLAEQFTVVRLDELLCRLEQGRPIGGCCVVTFDDGYKDNAEVAAPILLERGVPATFFIASGLVGTTTQTSWDIEHGVRSEWMSWEDVRALQRAGFTIGGHTIHHANLGELSPDEARDEVLGGLDRIEANTGERPDVFAYPYGRRNAITDTNRAVIASLGLRCCLSCYGGVVRPTDDPMLLCRTAYSPWFASPEQFGFDLLRVAAHRDPVWP